MEKLVTSIRKLELAKLIDFLNENPSKKEVLKTLNEDKNKISKQIAKLKEPEKKYSNFDRILFTDKYRSYQKEYRNYEKTKNEMNTILNDILSKIKMVETDQEYDDNRKKVVDLIPLIESAKSVEEIALYTFYGTVDVKSNSKYLLAIILLLSSVNIIKKDSDIERVYKGLDNFTISKKMEDINLEAFIKSLRKAKIDIDDGFYQFIVMIMNEKSNCSSVNLLSSFPILKQLKEDKEVPKNIRVALEMLDDSKNENRTIHEVGCEIFLKEIFYKIKENLNV